MYAERAAVSVERRGRGKRQTDVAGLVVPSASVLARREEGDSALALAVVHALASWPQVLSRTHTKYDHSAGRSSAPLPADGDHSVPSSVGCQCSSRMCPGSIDTSAIAISLDALKTAESTILMLPAFEVRVGACCESA
jgi:hypothetical protein